MIQMLRILKTDADNQSSKLWNIEAVDQWPVDFPDLQRMFFLAEQLLFSRYLLMLEPNNALYKKFKDKCCSSILNLPDYFEVGNEEVETYKQTLTSMVSNYNRNMEWGKLLVLLNDIRFDPELRQLPKDFYDPFIYELSGRIPAGAENVKTGNLGVVQTTYSPQLLYPRVYRDCSRVYLNYEAETFSTFHYTRSESLYSDSVEVLSYLSKFNWTGKQFGDIIGTMTNLVSGNMSETSDFLNGMYRGLLSIGTKNIIEGDGLISSLLMFTRQMCSAYGMPLTDLSRMGTFLRQFDSLDSHAVDYLIDTNPSVLTCQRFEKTSALQFLKPALKARRLELNANNVVGKEDNLSGDSGTDENDYSVEPDSSQTDEADDFTIADTSEDGGDNSDSSITSDDFDDDGDFGGFDDTTDTHGDTSDTAQEEGSEETDTQPEDPTTIAYNVLTVDPTVEAILYRHKVAAALRAVIQNPPSDLSTGIVAALRTWLTQWLYIASPTTTKRFLSLLLSDPSLRK